MPKSKCGYGKQRLKTIRSLFFLTFRLKNTLHTSQNIINLQYFKPCQIPTDLRLNKTTESYYNNSSEIGGRGILRNNFDGTGNVDYNQIPLLKNLLEELLESLKGKASKYPGMAKTLRENRCKYSYTGIANIVKNGFKVVKLAS